MRGKLQHFLFYLLHCCSDFFIFYKLFLSYASKPSKDYEDPEEVRAIQLAEENMGDFKLKSAKDYTVPEHLRINLEKKMAQVVELEEQVSADYVETFLQDLAEFS